MADLPACIGRYEIISRLGQGGMGSLYLSKDPKIGRLVAIKLVRQEFDTPEARQRFAREAQSAGTLRHPNIVTIFDVDEHEGLPFIAMEYVDGETLGELIRRKAPVALSKRLQWIEELCLALAYAHRQGVVHRDIKPANLMLDAEGALKVLDFGLARREASKFTQSHTIIGTPNYMSPEQIRADDIGPRSDIFAVGAVLYEVVCYNEAFPGSVHQAMHTIMYEQPVPLDEVLPGIDRGLVAIVERALQKDPKDRYQDLSVMRSDLAEVRQRLEVRSDESAMTMPMGAQSPVPRSARGSGTRGPGSRDGRSTPGSGGSKRVSTHRVSLQQKRDAQIESHLTAGRGFFEAGEIEKAREAVEQALMFDPDLTLGLQLMDDIAAEEESRQIAAFVAAARAELQRGQLEAAERIVAQALEVAPQHPQIVQLRETIETTRRELERARQVQETLRRARGQFAEGAFEVAVRTAGEVLAIDPDNAPARDLQTRGREAIENRDKKAERDAAAQAAVTEAREMYERGDREGAVAKLEAFTPPHDLVSAFLASLLNERVDSDRHPVIAMPPPTDDTLVIGKTASGKGPETARFAPGRSSEAPHIASSSKTLYFGVAAAIVVLAVVFGVIFTRKNSETPVNQSAAAPVDGAASATTTPAPAVVPPAPTVTLPPSLAAEPPVDQTGRDLVEAYRLLAQGQRPAAEKIAAQLRRRDPKNVEVAKLATAIEQWLQQEKVRNDAIAANAAAATAAVAKAAESAAPPPVATPPATSASAPAAESAAKPGSLDPAFTVLPGGGFAANSEPPAPPVLAELERPGIEAALRKYEKALSDKDIRAVSQIRTLNERQRDSWVKIFKDFKAYKLNLRITGPPVVDAEGIKATIPVEERVQQVDKNGFEITQSPRPVTYKLEKIGGAWKLLPP